MTESQSAQWWLNSGGEFDDTGSGSGSTIQGNLPSDNRWHKAYAASNPRDTDGGSHPQNIFRLINRHTFQDPHQHLEFEITRLNVSKSPNRNESNGVLLLSHYQDGDTLYYMGVRVDGQAVIKKKVRGTYYTMAIRPIYPGSYNRGSNPNLIPTARFIALDGDTVTNGNGTVTLRLAVDGTVVLETVDDAHIGGPPIRSAGFAGIRTDFMDVEFRNYSATEQ
jgi:hypothetical protein